MLEWLAKGARALAAGNAQAKLGLQSPHTAGAIVRVGRFLYSTSLLWITASWYTGYVNQRTQPGSGPQLVIGGTATNAPDRPDKTPNVATIGTNPNAPANPNQVTPQTKDQAGRKLVALAPNQLGVPGTAVAGYLWSAPSNQKQIPAFNRGTYDSLLGVANAVANAYGLRITSGYRAQSSGSLHGAGLAFDMVGNMNAMKRAATWAASNPALFQEIFVHNEGSGMHLHLGFYPDAAGIYNSGANRNVRPGHSVQSPAGFTG